MRTIGLLCALLALGLLAADAARTAPAVQRRLEAHLGPFEAHAAAPPTPTAAALAPAGPADSALLGHEQLQPPAAVSASSAVQVGHAMRIPLGLACTAPLIGGGVATGKCVEGRNKCLEKTNWLVWEVCSQGVCCIPKGSIHRTPAPAPTPLAGPGWWSEAPRSPWGLSWGLSPQTTTQPFASGGLYRVVFHTVVKSLAVPVEQTYNANVPPFDSGVVCTSKLQNVLPHFSVRMDFTYLQNDADHVFRIWQHIPITHAATAMAHDPSVKDRTGALCETNNQHAIQIEIVNVSETDPTLTKKFQDGIGRLLRWIKSQTNVQAVSPVAGFLSEAKSFGEWPGRMTCAEWDKFNGVCGHSHVPRNKHADPGPLDIAALLQRMKANA